MPETKILGPHTLPPPRRLPEGRETQDLAGGEGGKESSPPDSPLFYCRGERGEEKLVGREVHPQGLWTHKERDGS
jgi:hypothetical protein